jgi:hypothetical protein
MERQAQWYEQTIEAIGDLQNETHELLHLVRDTESPEGVASQWLRLREKLSRLTALSRSGLLVAQSEALLPIGALAVHYAELERVIKSPPETDSLAPLLDRIRATEAGLDKAHAFVLDDARRALGIEPIVGWRMIFRRRRLMRALELLSEPLRQANKL